MDIVHRVPMTALARGRCSTWDERIAFAVDNELNAFTLYQALIENIASI